MRVDETPTTSTGDHAPRLQSTLTTALMMSWVSQIFRDKMELLHLAEDREAAELWLSKNPHSDARLEVIGNEMPPEHVAIAVAA